MSLIQRYLVRSWLNVVLIVVVAVLLVITLAYGVHCLLLVSKGVSNEELRALYLTHKTEFHTLRQMFLEDAAKSPWQDFGVVPWDETSAKMHNIGTERMEDYRFMLERLGVRSMLGDKHHVHFPVRSWGWASKGRRQGLAWWDQLPAMADKDKTVIFLPIEDGWYVFDFH